MSLSAANKNIKNNRISSRSGSSTPTSFAQSIVSSSTDLSSSSSSTSSSSCCSSSASSQAMVVAAMMIANSVVVVPAVPSAASKVRRPQIPRTMPHDINCSSKTSKNGRFCATTTPCTCMFNRIIMTTLLLLNLVLLPHTIHAAPAASGYSRTVHVPIGFVFTLDVGVDGRTASPPSPDGFPGWARLNDSASQVYGIPQANDVGVYTIPLQERTVRVEVGNELKQRCEQEIKTIWLEIVDQQRIDELPMESQFNSVKSLLAKLNVRLADVRLFPFSYLDTYRTITEIMHELEQYQQQHPQQGQQKIHGQQIVYSVNISCGELNEQSSEVISAAIENGLSFQVVQGILVNLHQSVTTPAVPITNNGNGKEQTETEEQKTAASPTHSSVPLIILALILAVLVLVSIFWILIKRAKAGQEKHTDANGKARSGTAQLPSPAGDSTTPMLGHKGNADRTTTDGMSQENGAAGRK